MNMHVDIIKIYLRINTISNIMKEKEENQKQNNSRCY